MQTAQPITFSPNVSGAAGGGGKNRFSNTLVVKPDSRKEAIPIGTMRDAKIMDSDQNSPASAVSKSKRGGGLRYNQSRFQTVAGSSMAGETDGALYSTIDGQTSASPRNGYLASTFNANRSPAVNGR